MLSVNQTLAWGSGGDCSTRGQSTCEPATTWAGKQEEHTPVTYPISNWLILKTRGDCALPSMAVSLLPPPPDPQFVLRGTQSAVNALHFSGGTQAQGCPLLFSGSQNGLIHIWSLQTRRAVATLDGHGGQSVTWLQMLPQSPQLLSQGRDLRLCLWDLAEGRNAVVDSVCLESVGFCRSSVLGVGQARWMLAVPGKGIDEVQILEMPSKTSVCTLKPEADAKPGMPMCLGLWQVCSTHQLTNPGISDVTIRPDHKILATAGWDHRIRVFHWRTMKPLAVLAFHSASVHCVAFATNGLLAAGSKDQRISVWSLYQRM
ncbi:guanine nucleotide-binding protein subunit beta-like protein 1 isoform X4 [Cavia porcellus]|uniref:guanine nucleotide-binding protein subunit beta-like protein 1 isoform X4 n=1 Tax=Cavia porcellus TaxID=10141 RepID=UPI002FE0334A